MQLLYKVVNSVGSFEEGEPGEAWQVQLFNWLKRISSECRSWTRFWTRVGKMGHQEIGRISFRSISFMSKSIFVGTVDASTIAMSISNCCSIMPNTSIRKLQEKVWKNNRQTDRHMNGMNTFYKNSSCFMHRILCVPMELIRMFPAAK